jgi:hypothetical protein
MRHLILLLLLPLAAAPAAAAQGDDGRSDAQVYVDAAQRVTRAEEEARCAWYPAILHRTIDLRTMLRPLERFANRDGAVSRLQRAARREEERDICIGVSARTIAPWLRAAERDIARLQQRLRRAHWRDPDAVRPGQ